MEDKRYRINERIFSKELRVINSNGENLGVMPKEGAIKMAREQGLDLVEIGPKAAPPVAKVLDFKKFLYDERKKASSAKAKSKQAELKEFKFGPNIGEGDLNVRITRAEGFLNEKNRVKFTVSFHGRQIAFPMVGREKLEKVLTALAEVGKEEDPPRFINNKTLVVTLLPK